MKHYLLMAATAALLVATATSSCAKDNSFIPQQEETAPAVETYDLALRFQAEGVSEATVYFYDSDLVQVAVENIVIPETDAEIVNSTFISATKPEWVYTPGLQNGDKEDGGLLRIGGKNLTTKAGVDALLLVIKKE